MFAHVIVLSVSCICAKGSHWRHRHVKSAHREQLQQQQRWNPYSQGQGNGTLLSGCARHSGASLDPTFCLGCIGELTSVRSAIRSKPEVFSLPKHAVMLNVGCRMMMISGGGDRNR